MNAPIRCLVVDDEVLAREAIRAYVHADPGLEIVGEAADGPSAVQEIERLRPDLLFLDIQMPEMDGFQVLQRLTERSWPLPLTIFVTAYDSHALRAFEAHALDGWDGEPLLARWIAALRARRSHPRGCLPSESLDSRYRRGHASDGLR